MVILALLIIAILIFFGLLELIIYRKIDHKHLECCGNCKNYNCIMSQCNKNAGKYKPACYLCGTWEWDGKNDNQRR